MLCHKYARNDTNLSFLKYKITDYFQIPTYGGRGEGGVPYVGYTGICYRHQGSVFPRIYDDAT